MLVSYDENYPELLKAYGIPSFIVPFILGSSETISLTRTGDSFKMVTKTGKSIEFMERHAMTSDCRVGTVVQNDPPIFILGSSEMIRR